MTTSVDSSIISLYAKGMSVSNNVCDVE